MTVTLTTDGRFRVDLRPDREAAVEFAAWSINGTSPLWCQR